MNRILFVIDMQNDFIDMALGTKEAQAIVEPVAEYIKAFKEQGRGNFIIATRDTHYAETYLDSNEGRHLPVPHCIEGTNGWQINPTVAAQLDGATILDKHHFGLKPERMKKYVENIIMQYGPIGEFIFIGLCTDICVMSNASVLKALYPESKITVLKDLCAGVTPESHDAALLTMKMCQIDVE